MAGPSVGFAGQLQPASSVINKGNAEYIDGRAVIGYDNILDDVDLTVSSTGDAVGFPVAGIANYLTYDQWKPPNSGPAYATFSFQSGKTVDYVGIAAHNLFSSGCIVVAQCSDDLSSWTDMYPGGFWATSDSSVMLLLSQQYKKRYYRIGVNGLAAPSIGVVMMGVRMPLQRNLYVGHRPAPFQRDATQISNVSEGGQFIGRSIVRTMLETEIVLDKITPTWLRQYWQPFALHAEQRPFFFQWDTKKWVNETIFGWGSGMPKPSNSHPSFMQVSFKMMGM